MHRSPIQGTIDGDGGTPRMLVARYWASARAEGVRGNGRPTGLSRFGWSNTSQDDAERLARARADEAMVRRLAGEDVPHRERSLPYDAGEGIPIREEILRELDEGVLTRNSYGAVCLNTEAALFVDVDFRDRGPFFGCALSLAVVLGLVVAALVAQRSAPVAGALAACVVGGAVVAWVAARARERRRAGHEVEEATAPLGAWCRSHPGWLVRVYRTPNGLRLLPMHAALTPSGPEAIAFMSAMNADPRYVTMCRLQQCSRARLTPKSWRMREGPPRLTPRSGRWPLRDPEQIARRAEWVRAYDEARTGYAACRFLQAVGTGSPDPGVERVRALHDRWSGAETTLPLA